VLVYDKPSDAVEWATVNGSVLIISYDKLSRALGARAAKVKLQVATPCTGRPMHRDVAHVGLDTVLLGWSRAKKVSGRCHRLWEKTTLRQMPLTDLQRLPNALIR
jgi:hypothetical protein